MAALPSGTNRGSVHSLEVKFTPAPVFGSDIRDGFGEVPAVAIKIQGIVLALAIGMVRWIAQDNSAIFSRAFAVTFRILDADLDVLRVVWRDLTFRDGKAAISGFHLNAVIRYTKANGKAEGL